MAPQIDTPTNIVAIARRIAERAHAGEFRRGGAPGVSHPAAVAGKLAAQGEPAVVVAAAWLHDVLELDETDESLETLREAGLPDEVVQAVAVLTKAKGMSYDEYLRGVCQNLIARKVKVEDMLHNLSCSPTPRQIIKYERGLLALGENSSSVAR